MTPEQTLWQEVLTRAVVDAHWVGNEIDINGNRVAAVVNRDQSRAWINSNCDDFRDVCDRAGFDPDFIRTAFQSGRIDVAALKSVEAAKQKDAA